MDIEIHDKLSSTERTDEYISLIVNPNMNSFVLWSALISIFLDKSVDQKAKSEEFKKLILKKSEIYQPLNASDYAELNVPEEISEKAAALYNSNIQPKIKAALLKDGIDFMKQNIDAGKAGDEDLSDLIELYNGYFDYCLNMFTETPEDAQISSNKSEKILEGYVELMHRKVKSMYYGHDKIINSLKKIPIDGTGATSIIEFQEKDRKIETIVSFDVNATAKEANIDLKGFTRFDIDVLNAVASLTKSGNWYFSRFQIFEVITHYAFPQMSEKWSNDIHKSMKKWRATSGNIEISEAIKLYPKLQEAISELSTDTVLINWETLKARTRNGKAIEIYHVFRAPILFTIAELKGHVSCYDMRLLKTSKKNNSRVYAESIILKNYMFEQIQQRVKSPKSFQSKGQALYEPVMLLKTIYEQLNRVTKEEKRSTRKNLSEILQEMKEKSLIKDFELLPANRPSKIQLYLYDNKQLFLNADYKEPNPEAET